MTRTATTYAAGLGWRSDRRSGRRAIAAGGASIAPGDVRALARGDRDAERGHPPGCSSWSSDGQSRTSDADQAGHGVGRGRAYRSRNRCLSSTPRAEVRLVIGEHAVLPMCWADRRAGPRASSSSLPMPAEAVLHDPGGRGSPPSRVPKQRDGSSTTTQFDVLGIRPVRWVAAGSRAAKAAPIGTGLAGRFGLVFVEGAACARPSCSHLVLPYRRFDDGPDLPDGSVRAGAGADRSTRSLPVPATSSPGPACRVLLHLDGVAVVGRAPPEWRSPACPRPAFILSTTVRGGEARTRRR